MLTTGSRLLTGLARRSTGLTRFGSASMSSSTQMHGTTILCVRKNDEVVMIGDGMVSRGTVIVKPNAKKVRQVNDKVIAGFAGSTADAFALLERLEKKLNDHPVLTRACVELAKEWRTEKYMKNLEALLLVADVDNSYMVTGNGDVIETADGILGIGSGGDFALAAARALIDFPELSAEDVARRSMAVASDMCVHTNHSYIVEKLPRPALTTGEDQGETGSTDNVTIDDKTLI